MIETCRFKPTGTKLLGCEFEIDFDCDGPPKLSSDPRIRLTGLTSVGIFISHEYEIVAPRIVDCTPANDRPIPGCADARHYRFTLAYNIHDKIGFGINFGAGTGTFGMRLPSFACRHEFQTASICCDAGQPTGADPPVEAIPCHVSCNEAPQLGAFLFASVLLGLAFLYQGLDADATKMAFLSVIVLLAAVSAGIALTRKIDRRRVGEGAKSSKDRGFS